MKYLFLLFLTLNFQVLSQEKDPVLEDLQLTNQGILYENSEKSSNDSDPSNPSNPPETQEDQDIENSKEPSDNSEIQPSISPISPQTQDEKSSDDLELSIPSKTSTSFKKQHLSNESQQIKTLQQLSEKFPNEYQYSIHKLRIEVEHHFKPKPTNQKYTEYFQVYEKLLETYPNEKEIYWDFFHFIHDYIKWMENTSLYDTEISKQALNLLKDMNRKFNEDKKNSVYLCSYLISHHFYTEGLQKCEQAIRLNPQESMPYLLQFQHSQESQKKDLLLILRKFPEDPQVLYFVGNYFKNQKKYPLSIQYFKKALQIDIQNTNILVNLANALFQNEDYEDALSYYINACKINPTKVKSLFRKSKSLLSQKNLFKLASTYQTHINSCTL